MSDHRTPGQLIEELLAERGWSQRTLSVVLGKGETSINKYISGKQPLDAEMSLLLEEAFGVPAERFLGLQKSFDLAQARISFRPDPQRGVRALLFGDLPISEMIHRGWLSAESVKDTDAVSNELMRFFGVNRLEDIQILPHAAKKTAVLEGTTPAQLAWLFRVKQIAEDMLVPRYSEAALRAAIPKLKALTVSPEATAHVPRILMEAGVRFLVVESLKSAKIDGVCFWLGDDAPVIGMTLRFDRIDNFWFVLRHEIQHVLCRHGTNGAVVDAGLEGDRAGTGPTVDDDERIANSAAQEFLIPTPQLDAFIARKAPFFAERDLIGFAKIMKVHPGIVAGQLQRKTGRYDRFRDHLVNVRAKLLPNVIKDGWGDVAPVD